MITQERIWKSKIRRPFLHEPEQGSNGTNTSRERDKRESNEEGAARGAASGKSVYTTSLNNNIEGTSPREAWGSFFFFFTCFFLFLFSFSIFRELELELEGSSEEVKSVCC